MVSMIGVGEMAGGLKHWGGGGRTPGVLARKWPCGGDEAREMLCMKPWGNPRPSPGTPPNALRRNPADMLSPHPAFGGNGVSIPSLYSVCVSLPLYCSIAYESVLWKNPRSIEKGVRGLEHVH